MKKILLILFLTVTAVTLNAQDKKPKVDWKDVQVYELSNEKIDADSVGQAIAEWLIDSEATSLSELSPAEHISIKKKAASLGCNVAYVDVKKRDGQLKGQLYIVAYYKK